MDGWIGVLCIFRAFMFVFWVSAGFIVWFLVERIIDIWREVAGSFFLN